MMRMTLSQICSAVNGRLLSGAGDTAVASVSTDSRAMVPDGLFVPLTGENFNGHDFIEEAFRKGAGACLMEKNACENPSYEKRFRNRPVILVDSTLKALGDMAHWRRKQFDVKLAAVTGSNGKTTTKEMVWSIVRRVSNCLKNQGNQNNLIGLPLSLFQLTKQHTTAVVELGTNQKGEIRRLAQICSPEIGLITNIGPSHLEGLKSLNDIMEEKGALFEALPPQGTAAVNADDALVVKASKRTRADKLFFGFEKADIRATEIVADNRGNISFDLHVYDKSKTVVLQMPGSHSAANALAAAAVASLLGADIEAIAAGLESFHPVSGRMEVITLHGVRVINDSYNANPASMYAALKTLATLQTPGKRVAVLGDMLELGKDAALFHRQLGEQAAELGIDLLFFSGQYARTVRAGARSGGMSEEALWVAADLNDLSEMLKERIVPGDTVLVKGSRGMRMERALEMVGRGSLSG